MQVRPGTTEDAEAIVSLFQHARERMRESGNFRQWTSEYPTKEDFLDDIRDGVSYVVTDGDRIVGTFAFVIGEDPCYACIEDGEWPDSEPYGTIHRLAGDRQTKDVFRTAMEFCETKIDHIRVDTHEDNKPMLHLMDKFGFRRCGIVYMRNGTPRIAFSKSVQRTS